ncbi:MAG: hypothetical protein J6M60_06625 [Clostridia bacterium]|nr:hypothetical protein [Clostridia bacterium]
MENLFNKKEENYINELDRIFEKIFIDKTKNKKILEQCNITSQEAREGTVKKIEITYANVCDSCKGLKEKCKVCEDRGYFLNKKEFILKIPARVKENDYFEFLEQGNQFNTMKKRGDIHIKIHIYGKKDKRKGKKLNK